jgi:hypothetical protein
MPRYNDCKAAKLIGALKFPHQRFWGAVILIVSDHLSVLETRMMGMKRGKMFTNQGADRKQTFRPQEEECHEVVI